MNTPHLTTIYFFIQIKTTMVGDRLYNINFVPRYLKKSTISETTIICDNLTTDNRLIVHIQLPRSGAAYNSSLNEGVA